MFKTYLFKMRPLKRECSRVQQEMAIQTREGLRLIVVPGDWIVFDDDGIIVDVYDHEHFIKAFAPASKAGKQYIDGLPKAEDKNQAQLRFDVEDDPRGPHDLQAGADFFGGATTDPLPEQAEQ